MAFDPSRVFTASSSKTAAILCGIAMLGVLGAFAFRMFGFQGKFPGPPPLPPQKPSGEPNGEPLSPDKAKNPK